MALDKIHPAGKSGFKDHLDVKAADWLATWDGTRAFDVAYMGVPLSKTSISHSGAHLFPQAVRGALSSYGTYNIDADVDVAEMLKGADVGDVEMHATDLVRCHHNIQIATASYWSQFSHSVLMLMGGDHSITAPSISGLREALDRPIGVIHFDAHHDMRNLDDGGPTNGTPFRTLLEGNVIEGDRLIQIGLRNFANARAYTAYAKEKGAHIVTVNHVRQQGMQSVLEQALEIAGRDGAFIYVSFDIDVMDQAHAPGVPAPGPGGLTPWDAFYALQTLGEERAVGAFDYVCVDPTVDFRNLTARLAANLLLYTATGIAQRVR